PRQAPPRPWRRSAGAAHGGPAAPGRVPARPRRVRAWPARPSAGRRARAAAWASVVCSLAPPIALGLLLAAVWLVLLAGLLRRLERRGVRVDPAGAALYLDPAVGLGVGDVDAVLAHAPGERQQLLLLLRAALGGLAAVGEVLVAGLLRRLERRGVR